MKKFKLQKITISDGNYSLYLLRQAKIDFIENYRLYFIIY